MNWNYQNLTLYLKYLVLILLAMVILVPFEEIYGRNLLSVEESNRGRGEDKISKASEDFAGPKSDDTVRSQHGVEESNQGKGEDKTSKASEDFAVPRSDDTVRSPQEKNFDKIGENLKKEKEETDRERAKVNKDVSTVSDKETGPIVDELIGTDIEKTLKEKVDLSNKPSESNTKSDTAHSIKGSESTNLNEVKTVKSKNVPSEISDANNQNRESTNNTVENESSPNNDQADLSKVPGEDKMSIQQGLMPASLNSDQPNSQLNSNLKDEKTKSVLPEENKTTSPSDVENHTNTKNEEQKSTLTPGIDNNTSTKTEKDKTIILPNIKNQKLENNASESMNNVKQIKNDKSEDSSNKKQNKKSNDTQKIAKPISKDTNVTKNIAKPISKDTNVTKNVAKPISKETSVTKNIPKTTLIAASTTSMSTSNSDMDDLDLIPDEFSQDVNINNKQNPDTNSDVVVDQKAKGEESQKNHMEQQISKSSEEYPEEKDNHFFAYFVTGILVFAIGYLIVHNKQKILGLIVEGRTGRARRRSHTYKRLENEGAKFSQVF